jgi:hypothetical protein
LQRASENVNPKKFACVPSVNVLFIDKTYFRKVAILFIMSEEKLGELNVTLIIAN